MSHHSLSQQLRNKNIKAINIIIDNDKSIPLRSISSETKTLSTSSNNLSNENDDSENENLRSSTACLVSLDVISKKGESSNAPTDETLSQHSLHSNSISNNVSKEASGLIGVLKSSKDNNENDADIGGSTTSSNSPKSGTSGRRSGANLTVTFDFDYEDRSIGNEISDTPRSHIFKDVPNFIQSKLFGSVKGRGITKRLRGIKQHSPEKEVTSKQSKSDLQNSGLKSRMLRYTSTSTVVSKGCIIPYFYMLFLLKSCI